MSIPLDYSKIYLFQDEFKRIFYDDYFWHRLKTKEEISHYQLEKICKRKFAEFIHLIYNAYHLKNAEFLPILHGPFKQYHDLLILLKNK